MNRSYPSDMSVDGLYAEVARMDDTILNAKEEAATRLRQADMAHDDGDRAQAMYYRALAQVARDAAMLAGRRRDACASELTRRGVALQQAAA